ncbi:MAG: DMT family transporter [Thiotrichales bacterium]|nr:DMT family transporter [Thiotrichales bacterium]
MRVVMAYVAVVLIWTTTPLAIVWGSGSDWFYAVALRTLLGAMVLIPFAFWFGFHRRLQMNRAALKTYAYAVLPVFGGMTFMYWAGQYLPSGWIAILFATTPLMTGVIAHYLLPNSSFSVGKLAAIGLSLLGLIIIFAPNLEQSLASTQILAILAAFASVFAHSLGTVLIKKSPLALSTLDTASVALIFSALLYLMIAPQLMMPSTYPSLTERQLAAIVYAALVGSVVGFMLFFYLVKQLEPIKVAMIPVITPLFAILLGHFLNNEPLGWDILVGATLVVFGLILFQRQNRR